MHDLTFANLTDGELAYLAQSDENAFSEIISRYLPTVRRLARVYSSNLSDQDDLVSEGLLALMNSVKTYDRQKEASFSTYASVCINNRMRNLLKKSDRISKREESIEDKSIALPTTPESILIDREIISQAIEDINNLSSLEKEVFTLYIHGESYSGIAKKLSTSTKSVDNALARVRKKLRQKI